jgi:hypothetical protein
MRKKQSMKRCVNVKEYVSEYKPAEVYNVSIPVYEVCWKSVFSVA